MKLWIIPHDGEPTLKFNLFDIGNFWTHLKMLYICWRGRNKIKVKFEF